MDTPITKADLDAAVEQIGGRLGQLEERVGGVEDRMGRVEERIGRVEDRIDGLGTQVFLLAERMERVDARVGGVESRLLWRVTAFLGVLSAGIIATVVGAFLAVVLTI